MRDARLIIEPLPTVAELDGLTVSDAERQTAAGFGSERRICEYLAWRHIVRREFGRETEIGYTNEGRPVITNNPDINIGVAHNADFVAVIISPQRCAVDIERLSRDFSKATPRFLTDAERQLSDDGRLTAAVWCAKETLYKYSDMNGLDFLHDLGITDVDFAGGTVTGNICGGAPVTMRMLEHAGCLVVYVG